MLIRCGYEISFTASAPTPMMAMLNIHPSRNRDLKTPHRLVTTPEVPMYDYLDAFGNTCTRLVVPEGGITLAADFVVEDSGLPDRQSPDAVQHPVEDLPDDILVFPARQPLLRDRPTVRHRVGAVRPRSAGMGPGRGDRRVGA